MSRRLISTLILLATLSVAGIITTQIYWLDKAFKVQRSQFDLRKEQALADAKQFNDRVTIALTNVANEILTINNDPAKLFEAVKQVRPNYFTVAINDTVHPYLLESLLIREFGQRNIGENFEYGVYDCFTDSIVYGNYVGLVSNNNESTRGTEVPQIKWDKDGHYFGVFFPDRDHYEMVSLAAPVSTWAFSAIISLIVFVFFAYSVFIVLRQKRLSEMKTDFINNMTHELKTPISTISLSSEVLMSDQIASQPERLKQYAQLIFNENNRLRLQVEKVLQLASLDKDKVNLQLEEVDLHQAITEAKKALEMVYPNGAVSISLRLNAEPSILMADAVHMGNIIHNLLDNAIKYSAHDAKVELSTSTKGNAIVLSVKDHGIGIPGKSLPYIFDKFYRVPKGNVHDVKGFGLGLYYVKQMIGAHQGQIDVKSHENQGTNFIITLPLKPLS
jgi:two-component system phosphate regulon sensor histidine kinase PhoR